MEQDNRKIVWLASYPKSGNTWFRIFLSSLLSKKDQPVNINELSSTPIASSRSLFDDTVGVTSSDLTQDEIQELRPQAYRQIAANSDEILFHKVHDSWVLTPAGKPVFPAEITKAVIYFVRNPLDVTVSFAFHGRMKLNNAILRINDSQFAFCSKKDRIYYQIMQPLNDWSGHIQSWVDLSGLPVKILKYEDMLKKPFETFKFAVSYLGIDASDENIISAIEQSRFERLKELEEAVGFSEKPIGMKSFFRSGKSGDWTNYFKKKQVIELVNKQREFMDRFGYLDEMI